MGKPYSIDLRERVVAAVETGGMSCHRAAAQFGVGVNTAILWVRRFRQTGSVARDRWAGTSRRRLRASIVPGCWNGRDRPDVARRRVQWAKYQNKIEPERLVFIDETWTKTNMAPLRGWAPLGIRLRAKVPHRRWKTTTFLAALRHDRIDAPWLLEGPIDGESFRAYVEKLLVPTLREGDIVIMDNLGSHKGKAVRQLIRSAGAKLFFLPKYSPDLNSIEQVCAKLKHLLRKAGARQVETIGAAIGEILGAFTPQECTNYSETQAMYQPKIIML